MADDPELAMAIALSLGNQSVNPSHAAALLDALLGGFPACAGALNTLFKNIVSAPGDERYRKLRQSNPALQARLLSRPGAVPLLRAVGFLEEGDFLTLPPGVVLPPAVVERVAAASEALSAAGAGGGVGGSGGGGCGGGGGGGSSSDRGPSRLPPASDEYHWCSSCRKSIDKRFPKNTTFRCLACDIDLCPQCYNLRSCEHDFDIISARGGGFGGMPPPPPPSSRPPGR